jgi:hypothetical protein
LWQIGPIEDAARAVVELVDDLRAKPSADADMAVAFGNAIGILGEAGRVEEAAAAARHALPMMRRAQTYFVDVWAYLFWRRGQREAAARLIGVSNAGCVRSGAPRESNEERLIAQARADLEARMGADAFAGCLAAGTRLREAELYALISDALAQPTGE